MRAVVQRVLSAGVAVEGRTVAAIGEGLTALVGVSTEDDAGDAKYIADKLCGLRVFDDEAGVMNLPLKPGGEILLVSQFTLYGDVRHGRRPSYAKAAKPEEARRLFELLARGLSARAFHVQTGRFQADMQVSLVNDGPVTILLDSKKGF